MWTVYWDKNLEAVVERWPLEEVRLYSEIDRRRLVEKRAYS